MAVAIGLLHREPPVVPARGENGSAYVDRRVDLERRRDDSGATALYRSLDPPLQGG
jgi:hypothetical protein